MAKTLYPDRRFGHREGRYNQFRIFGPDLDTGWVECGMWVHDCAKAYMRKWLGMREDCYWVARDVDTPQWDRQPRPAGILVCDERHRPLPVWNRQPDWSPSCAAFLPEDVALFLAKEASISRLIQGTIA